MADIHSVFINEILTTIKKIKKLLKNVTFADFNTNYHLVDNVIKYLKVIGEASKHVSKETQSEYKNIPWSQLKNLRDIENNPEHIELVWNIATVNLPEIKPSIKDVLN